ncbi:hypothetical protein HOD38_04860 [archaeon]|jgi:hypothetical protein|nr:hypothetical protein [archaeon]MBT4397571.1 hypothetical protein [archaeon]MBT4440826.1 hypothetical protein [archaeon]
MVIKALTPSSKPTKVREMIVNILTTDFPLSIKKLKLLLKKNYNKSVSYQAIHKEINNLIDDKIAIKKDQKFQLNIHWLQEVRFSTDLVLSNYSSKKRNSILRLLDLKRDGDTVSFDFSSYNEIDAFFLELFDYYSDLFPQKNTILMHYSNNWWPLLYPMEERRIFSKIKADVYGITALKYTLNKWCCEYEKSIGINVHFTPTKDGIQWTHNVFGDLLFNIYLDEDINKKIVKFFNKNRDFRGINLRELIEIIHEKGNFKLVVIKDTAFTKSVLETELKLFKNS